MSETPTPGETTDPYRVADEAPAMPDTVALEAAAEYGRHDYQPGAMAYVAAVGWQRGWVDAYAAGRAAGYETGRHHGYEQGHADGFDHGRDAGPCMDPSPCLRGSTPLLCELRAGHTGGHQSGATTWTKGIAEVERAQSERDAYEAGMAAGREAAAQDIAGKASELRTWPSGSVSLNYIHGWEDAAEFVRGGGRGE